MDKYCFVCIHFVHYSCYKQRLHVCLRGLIIDAVQHWGNLLGFLLIRYYALDHFS